MIGLSTWSWSQDLSKHNWYFGNSVNGIRFNRTTNLPMLVTNKAIPFGTGGSAVATDKTNGNLLFYTDGTNIYDATHAIMPGGAGLGGNSSGNQPVAIAKVPGQNTQYYVFVNSANGATGGTISSIIVDMSQFGNAVFPNPPLGAAIGAVAPVAGLTGRAEAMITVPHANGEDFWLITHANGTPDYLVCLFNASGLASTLNVPGLGLIERPGNFSYHEGLNRIAVSPQEPTRDIELLTFDNTNGVPAFFQTVLNTGLPVTGTQSIYDTEWSNSGRYLYISNHGEAGIQADVLQYDVASPFTSLASVLPQPNTISRSYGLQMAPDSLIYHLYQATAGGNFVLGSIADSDTVASAVTYDRDAFASNPNFNALQFPSFAPADTILMSVTFTARGTCSNAPTSFFPTVEPGADSLVWDFGDGNGGSGWSPVHVYQQGGAFNVTVTAFLNGNTATATNPVNITQFDLQLQLVQDTTACVCELPVNNGQPTATPGFSCPNDTSDDFSVQVQAQGGSPTFQWFGPGGILPSQNTATLRPDSAGYYYVVATQGSCSAYAGVNIKEYDSLDQRANIWYFGQRAGIDFNALPDGPVVPIQGPLDTPEGCAVICDRNGQVIFSTDGMNIYDKDDNLITSIPTPPGLGGEPGSTQSAIIMPVQGDETLFYIFTTQEVHGTYGYELKYSLFDLKLNGGLGGLAEVNKSLFTKSTERLTASANWLIAHEFGNNSFRAYPVSQAGIGNPVVSAIGSDHNLNVVENGQGYMELGGQNRLVVALSTPGTSNVVEIFDFVDSTGAVTNFRTKNLGNPAGQVYGIEISPTGNKLFATIKNTPTSEIVELAFDTLGIPYFVQRVTQTGELGAMQRGPDGQVYVAINGSNTLGTFTINEDTTLMTTLPVPLQPFALLAGTSSELGLPNFIQIIANPASQPNYSFANTCLGDSTSFFANGKDPAIDKFDWNFGDGSAVAFDGGAQINHLYNAAGTYTVTLTIRNKCENPVAFFTFDVTITAPPADPSSSVPICNGPALLDANPGNVPGLTYDWAIGSTNETISTTVQGNYDVTITDAVGCVTDATFMAVQFVSPINFGADQTVCQNTVLPQLDAQNPTFNHSWTLNGVNNGNTSQFQAIDTSLPGVFTYAATVTDPVTLCVSRDTVTYDIKESPAFTATPTNPTTCAANDGQIDLAITAPAGTLFTYFITGPATASGTDQAISPPNVVATNLPSGTYGITVTDQVSGCTTTNTATVNDPAFTVAGAQNATCDPIGINFNITETPGPLTFNQYTFRVINSATTAEIQGPTSVFTVSATLTNIPTITLPSNNQQYIVEVTNGACIASSPAITVNESPASAVTFNSNGCANPITVTATVTTPGAPTFAWTGPNITSASNGASITATPPQGAQIYNLTVTQPGLCALDTTVTVNVANTVTANFSKTDECADVVTLDATPIGTYTYRWYLNNAILPDAGQQIAATTTGAYRVELVDAISGCSYQSTDQPVTVAGDLQVFISNNTLLCEGVPFTLTANVNQTTGLTFQWSFNGSPITGQTNSTVQDTREGNYLITVRRENPTGFFCTQTHDFDVELAPLTRGLLQDTGEICPDDPNIENSIVVLDPGPNFVSYQWYKNEVVETDSTKQTYAANDAGIYRVEMINLYGCPSQDVIVLEEECDPRISGPTAFRPTSNVMEGGELVNREFRLFTFFIADTDFQIYIYNRWGEMVFQSNSRDFRWNGSYNNNLSQPLPPGTYSYIVKFKSSYSSIKGIQEKRGGVVLLR